MGDDEIIDTYVQTYDEEAAKVCRELLRGNPKNQEWKVVPKYKLEAVYKEYARNGYQFFRKFPLIDSVANAFLVNVVKLQINNEISGHDILSVEDFFSQNGYEDIYENDITEEELYDRIGDYILAPDGSWRISDYGMKKLNTYIDECLSTDDYTQKFIALDKFLNVCHQRSDLAEMFIEGGTRTLNALASKYLPEEPEE
jgi:hypothetical protein